MQACGGSGYKRDLGKEHSMSPYYAFQRDANSAQSTAAFFAAVNHFSGRLRKQKCTSTGS